MVYKKETVENDDNSSNVTEINGFKAVYVFDISQTDGDKLPEFARVQGDPSHPDAGSPIGLRKYQRLYSHASEQDP